MSLWLALFVVSGFLLFGFKISGDGRDESESPKLRIFLLIAAILFALAGIADFVRWVGSSD